MGRLDGLPQRSAPACRATDELQQSWFQPSRSSPICTLALTASQNGPHLLQTTIVDTVGSTMRSSRARLVKDAALRLLQEEGPLPRHRARGYRTALTAASFIKEEERDARLGSRVAILTKNTKGFRIDPDRICETHAFNGRAGFVKSLWRMASQRTIWFTEEYAN